MEINEIKETINEICKNLNSLERKIEMHNFRITETSDGVTVWAEDKIRSTKTFHVYLNKDGTYTYFSSNKKDTGAKYYELIGEFVSWGIGGSS